MANLRVELRKRTGSTYGDKVLVATETTLVEGLLNPDGKIKENLFPTSVFGGLRFVSSIGVGNGGVETGLVNLVDNSADNLQLSADLITIAGATPTKLNIDLFRGMYFIVSSPITLVSGTEGSPEYEGAYFNEFVTDDGYLPTNELSPGDWVVCTGWGDNPANAEVGVEFSIVNNTYGKAATNRDGLMSKEHFTKLNGLSNYTHPSYTAFSEDAVDVDVLSGISVDNKGHVTSTTIRTLPPASSLASGVMTKEHFTKLNGIETGANKYTLPTASASVKGGLKIGSRLSMSGEVLSADSQTDNNFTTVLKNKLDLIEAGANKYTHPDDGVAATHTLTAVESVSQLQINLAGHVTGFSKQAIRAASNINTGISRFATAAEGKASTLDTVGVTPSVLGTVINYVAGLPVFASISTANAAAVANTYKDGSFAFVEV